MLSIFQFFATKTDASALRMLNGSPAERLLKPISDYIEAKGGRIHTRWGCRYGWWRLPGAAGEFASSWWAGCGRQAALHLRWWPPIARCPNPPACLLPPAFTHLPVPTYLCPSAPHPHHP
jgi:hypothetical protein